MRAAVAAVVVMLVAPAADVYLVSAEPRMEPSGLSLTIPAPGIIRNAFKEKLSDGLTHRVRYSLALYEDGGKQPVVTDVLTSDVMYDLWGERYAVKHTQQLFAKPAVSIKTVNSVVTALEKPRFRSLAINPVPGRAYVAEVFVEVDVVSQAAQDRAREMIAPPPKDSESGGGRSILGQFLGRFVDDASMGPNGGSWVFRTRPFVPVPGGAP